MNVIVFGASGTIGKPLVEQLLMEGHSVSAFCRDTSKLDDLEHPRLRKVKGDVLIPADVNSAVEGQDVVCVALGSGKDRKSTVRSQGTKHIIVAMKALGVKRLICQSTLGTGESNANLNFFWKHIMFGWFLKKVFLDHELQERYVRESSLDWTILRPAAFTDGAKTQTYKHGFGADEPSLKLKISRADVVDFFLTQLGDAHYLHQSPGLSY